MSCSDNHYTTELKLLAERKKEFIKFENDEKLTWCSGCGDYGIQKALERALVLEGIKNDEVAFFFDIGCNGNGADKLHGYTFHGLHGRVISAAAGAALANPKMKIIAEGGDGGTFSEGINHLVHGVRSNYPMLFILHNNENYGLTIGQASSMTRLGQSMNGSPDGPTAAPMNACEFVLGLNPSWVGRSFSGDVKHTTDMIRQGLRHNGFAFLEIMQLCPTFNKATSQTWFLDRIRYVEDLKGYDPSDLDAARKAARDLDKEIMTGLLYEDKTQVSFPDRVPARAGRKTALIDEVDHVDITGLMEALQ